MGTDGLLGSRVLREAGAPTVVQDEESSVVWGMAGAGAWCFSAGATVASAWPLAASSLAMKPDAFISSTNSLR